MPRLVVTIPLLLACALGPGCDDPGPTSFGDSLTDPQLPARGADDALTWLEGGFYQAWRCEAEAHGPRPPSPHGRTRICSNEALATATGAGAFPVGAASVKEIVDGAGAIELYAVARKVTAGDGGDSWYWFEGSRGDVIANAAGDGTCTGCHAGAARDFVFTVVP